MRTEMEKAKQKRGIKERKKQEVMSQQCDV